MLEMRLSHPITLVKSNYFLSDVLYISSGITADNCRIFFEEQALLLNNTVSWVQSRRLDFNDKLSGQGRSRSRNRRNDETPTDTLEEKSFLLV
jgi:hypothetical protein